MTTFTNDLEKQSLDHYRELDKLPDNYKWDLAMKNGDVVEVGDKTYNFEKLEGSIKAFKGNKAI